MLASVGWLSYGNGTAEKRSDHLLRLQVALFPPQASRPRFGGDESDLALPVLHFPMLRGIVEFDVGGPVDFEPAEFM